MSTSVLALVLSGTTLYLSRFSPPTITLEHVPRIYYALPGAPDAAAEELRLPLTILNDGARVATIQKTFLRITPPDAGRGVEEWVARYEGAERRDIGAIVVSGNSSVRHSIVVARDDDEAVDDRTFITPGTYRFELVLNTSAGEFSLPFSVTLSAKAAERLQRQVTSLVLDVDDAGLTASGSSAQGPPVSMLAVGGEVSGAFADGGVRYELRVERNTEVEITVESPQDPVLELLDRNLQHIEVNDDGVAGARNARLVRFLEAGTYYANIREFNAAAGQFTIRARAAGRRAELDPAPDRLALGEPLVRPFAERGTDFTFEVEEPRQVRIDVVSVRDPVLEVLDGTLAVIGGNDDASSDTRDAQVVLQLQRGVYRARVKEYSGQDGQFEIAIRAARAGESLGPTVLAVGRPASATFLRGGHLSRLNIAEAMDVQIDVTSDRDPVLELLDDDLALITSNDDAGSDTRNAQVHTRLEAGSYFVRVKEYNNADGSFTVQVAGGR